MTTLHDRILLNTLGASSNAFTLWYMSTKLLWQTCFPDNQYEYSSVHEQHPPSSSAHNLAQALHMGTSVVNESYFQRSVDSNIVHGDMPHQFHEFQGLCKWSLSAGCISSQIAWKVLPYLDLSFTSMLHVLEFSFEIVGLFSFSSLLDKKPHCSQI